MIFEQYKQVYNRYPGLSLNQNGENKWFIKGLLHFLATYNGVSLDDKFEVLILIPEEYPAKYPKVTELGNRIPMNFHHYTNNTLCLGIPHEINSKFKKNPTLLGFIEEHLIPYLYGFCYKQKYGKVPFGEWKHDGDGIIEYYQNKLGLYTEIEILAFLSIMVDNYINSHILCPCKSGKKLTECHGPIIKELISIQHSDYFYVEYLAVQDSLITKGLPIPSSIKCRRYMLSKAKNSEMIKR